MHFPGYWDIFRYRVDPFLPVLQRLKKEIQHNFKDFAYP